MRIFTLTAAVLFAAFASAQDTAPKDADQAEKPKTQQQADKDTAPLTPEKVIAKLHKCNQKEIMAGKLALEKGSSDEIKQFGQKLIDDHKKADEKVQQAARDNNIPLPQPKEAGKVDAEKPEAGKDAKAKGAHDADLKHLQSLTGEEFDRGFAKHMLKDHEDTLAFLDRVKADNNVSALHGLVDSIRPGLEQHAMSARGLASKLGVEETAKTDEKKESKQASIKAERGL